MKIAFYKGWSADWKDKLICIWTFSRFSHCEIVGTDGLCYSSSPRDGGVRKKEIDLDSGHWEVFDIVVEHKRFEYYKNQAVLNKFFESTKGLQYDWKAIYFSMGINIGLQDKDKWFCSEWCATFLNKRFGLGLETQISPGRLYKKLKYLKFIK